MSWFEPAHWRNSGTSLLSKKISNYIAAAFIVTVVFPWIGFASLNSQNRAEQIELAKSDVAMMASAYAEHVRLAAAINPSRGADLRSSVEVPDWLRRVAGERHVRLSLRSQPGPLAAGLVQAKSRAAQRDDPITAEAAV